MRSASESSSGHRAVEPGDWAPGTVIAGKYEVVRRLGDGSLGAVYRVRHVHRQKYYALKTPLARAPLDDAFRARFEREIEAMERFVHPDAITVRDSGIAENGVPYYTMDFVEGESLGEVLRRDGALSIDRGVGVVRRILGVLDAAHGSGVIHRDVKPDNILLTSSAGREAVKVADFGVAKLCDLVGLGTTALGQRVGTPRYMSPEQVLAKEIVPSSDLFSLGIVFFEILSGEHPFSSSDDAGEVATAIVRAAPRDLRVLCPEVPAALVECIYAMLDKDADRRPASAAEVLGELDAICGCLEEDGARPCGSKTVLSVCRAVRRRATRRLVLCQETSKGERRSFLLFDDRCSFGRTNDPARDIRNDLVLRSLPCRSRALDAANWQRNVTIRQFLGEISADSAAVVVSPAPETKFGIAIGGVQIQESARLHTDRFHLSLGDRALELDGRRVLRDIYGPEYDLSVLRESGSSDDAASDSWRDRPLSCRPVDYIHLERPTNWQLHEYFLVCRQVDVGSSAGAGLRIRGRHVEPSHARIVREGDEAFIIALEGEVLVRGAIDDTTAEGLEASDVPGAFRLARDYLLPIAPGLELLLGDARIRVDVVTDAHFKTV